MGLWVVVLVWVIPIEKRRPPIREVHSEKGVLSVLAGLENQELDLTTIL
jgi:hypothetical protein